jgi:hypothetical protein
MVPDAVYNVDFGKITEALAGKVRALETPGYLFLFGAAAETVSAVPAGRIDVVGKTPIAADFFSGDPVGVGHFL